jgi:hypothetical protein
VAAPVKATMAHNAPTVATNCKGGGTMTVAAVLVECKASLVADWLKRIKNIRELDHLRLSDKERNGHIPKLVEDLIECLGKAKSTSKDSDAIVSLAAIAHGKLRCKQGYSAATLIHESGVLQVTVFRTLHKHLTALVFTALLPDVMIIADEVDSQLTQTMESYTEAARKSEAAELLPLPPEPRTARPSQGKL